MPAAMVYHKLQSADAIDGGEATDTASVYRCCSAGDLHFQLNGQTGNFELSDGTTGKNIETIYFYSGSGDDTFHLMGPSPTMRSSATRPSLHLVDQRAASLGQTICL
jgi:hypothetical protein